MAPKSKPVTDPLFRVKIGSSTFDYPFVSSDRFKQGDMRLISQATGMEWEAWLKLCKKHGLDTALTRQGFFAVAVQRARDLDADQVVAFIDDLPLIDGVELVFPSAAEGDALPPEPGKGGTEA